MSKLLNDISKKMYCIIMKDKPIAPFYNYTHLLNENDWITLAKWTNKIKGMDYDDPHISEKLAKNHSPQVWKKKLPSYISSIRFIHENIVYLKRTDMFVNSWFFKQPRRNKYNIFLGGIAHETVHYIEYIIDKKLPESENITKVQKYTRRFKRKYPEYGDKVRRLLKKQPQQKFDNLLDTLRRLPNDHDNAIPTKMPVEKFMEMSSKGGTTI